MCFFAVLAGLANGLSITMMSHPSKTPWSHGPDDSFAIIISNNSFFVSNICLWSCHFALITNWQRQKTMQCLLIDQSLSVWPPHFHICVLVWVKLRWEIPHFSQNHKENLTSRETHFSSCTITSLKNPSFIWVAIYASAMAPFPTLKTGR